MTKPGKATAKEQTAGNHPEKPPKPAALLIASLGGVGDIPWAPGTFGSLVAVGLVVLFDRIPFVPSMRTPLLFLAVGIVFGIGVAAAGRSEILLGRQDPGQVVIDELAGQMVAFLLKPAAKWELLLAGFVAFRLFDIWKPFPARQAERLPGGWGIMVDDIVAGAYAMIVVLALGHWFR